MLSASLNKTFLSLSLLRLLLVVVVVLVLVLLLLLLLLLLRLLLLLLLLVVVVVVVFPTVFLCTVEGTKEMFDLTTHSTHFIYGYMASDIR